MSAPHGVSTQKHLNDWPNSAGFDVMYEQKVPVELQVKGNIPAYVSGILYRTGPQGYDVTRSNGEVFTAEHWFDGFSQIHRFELVSPSSSDKYIRRVLYNSRYISDPLIAHIKEKGRIGFIAFAQKRDPCESLFRKVMSVFIPPRMDADVNNVGVTVSINHPGLQTGSVDKDTTGTTKGGIRTLHTATDATTYAKVDPETLEFGGILSQQSIHPDLVGPLSAAHPQNDPTTGDLYNYNLAFGASGSTYRVFHSSASTGTTEILATIKDAPGTYIHSFIMTENYIVLILWSGQYAWGGLKTLWKQNLLEALKKFDPSYKPKWYVIDRKHGKGVVAKYESEAFFCFHTCNSWEETTKTQDGKEKTDIIVNLMAYENMDILEKAFICNLKSTGEGAPEWTIDKRPAARPNLRRFRLSDVTSASSKPVTRQVLQEFTVPKAQSGDLPTYNPKFKFKPSRYLYYLSDRGLSSFLDGIVKYDMETHEAKIWEKKGHNPGEAIFVPDPDGVEEDDGMLLSVICDGFEGKSYLLVLDAKTLTEVGRAEMETVVGFGFHGAFRATTTGKVVDF
ncbi:carotenoid oxygenase [Abortiporus biennis]|nr:carotenoid oxygenase [Abortiporus biennis]